MVGLCQFRGFFAITTIHDHGWYTAYEGIFISEKSGSCRDNRRAFCVRMRHRELARADLALECAVFTLFFATRV